jgi:thiamine-phosphate pyrophosphorylase
MFNKLQYISQGTSVEKQLHNIQKALDNGCEWIQLRFKNKDSSAVFRLAEATKIMCEEYLATFIINDDAFLAQKIAADGVHLGLSDMSVTEARSLLGSTKIIGGTANTFEDVLQRVTENCDYIGLGPYQFTRTKENLSPVLGLQGYISIMEQVQSQDIQVPIYAIGGIRIENVEDLIETGVHGIAVSGLITNSESENLSELINEINQKLYAGVNI